MLFHAEEEDVETSIDRVCHNVFLVSLLCIYVSCQVDNVLRRLIHVENRGHRIEANRMQLIRFLHRDARKLVKVFSLHSLLKLANMLLWQVLCQPCLQ